MILVIVQARMGSTRLPGKVMKNLLGKPMLWHLVQRLSGLKFIDRIVIAVPDKESDKVLLKLADEMGVDSFAGDEEDVLDRYYRAAKKYDAETIVRITSDCPLVDPEIIDKVIQYYIDNRGKFDIVSTGFTFPGGFDTEVFSFDALETSWKETNKPQEREHVTAYIWNNPSKFNFSRYQYFEDLSHIRLVVDYEEDFKLIIEIFENLYKSDKVFHIEEIIHFLSKNPHLFQLNERYAAIDKVIKDKIIEKERTKV